MEYSKLKNGIKLIYKNIPQNITSFCIGFDAGAIREEGFPLGTAHAVEHMVFKGTKNRTEEEINILCDEIFGFQNAMTNYPYVIYYGTTLSCDFSKGLDIFSDIVKNPTFSQDGFKEEMDVIYQELKDWKDDLSQFCEDELFFNAFNKRRIKNLIIGTKDSIKSITLDDIKSFYEKYYSANNMTISVISSLDFETVKHIVEEKFEHIKNHDVLIEDVKYERNECGVFVKLKENTESAKIQYCYPIHMLNEREIKALTIFNHYFGQGTSSILYDIIRTKNGLAYEIYSSIKNENGIKLFCINLATSKEKVGKALKLIDSSIEYIKREESYFTFDKIAKASKSIALKKTLDLEKSIQMAKALTTYEIMYKDYNKVLDENNNLENITSDEINQVINKVLNLPSIQIIQ